MNIPKNNDEKQSDDDYFTSNIPEGFEPDIIDYDYIWVCEPQMITPGPEPQIYVGQIYDGFTEELYFHTYIKTILTSPSGESRTFVKFLHSKVYPNVDDE